MRFARYPKPPPREINGRRLSAARRAIAKDKESWALFPEFVKHQTPEERIAAVDHGAVEWSKQRRQHIADAWRRARAALRELPDEQWREAAEFWQRGVHPATPEYLLRLVTAIKSGRFSVAEHDREVARAREIGQTRRSGLRKHNRPALPEPEAELDRSPEQERFLQAMGQLSQQLQAVMKSRQLSISEVDVIARRACGRRWCDFVSETDYLKTIAAVKIYEPQKKSICVQTKLHLC